MTDCSWTMGALPSAVSCPLSPVACWERLARGCGAWWSWGKSTYWGGSAGPVAGCTDARSGGCWIVGHHGTQRDKHGAQTIPVQCLGVSS